LVTPLKKGQKKKVNKIFTEYDKDVAHFRVNKKNVKHYKEIVTAAGKAIRLTERIEAPWVLIDAYDWRYRNISVVETLVNLFENAIKRKKEFIKNGKENIGGSISYNYPSILDNIDLTLKIDKKDYEDKTSKASTETLGTYLEGKPAEDFYCCSV